MIILEYVVFFGMLAVGIICFVLFKVPQTNVNPRNNCESPIERRLYDSLTFNGFDVHTQVKCGPYRIDLALYLADKMIAIECDGKEFHSTPAQKRHDRKKDAHLRKNGWEVVRFTGRQINRNLPSTVAKIKELSYG
jgi:very-short-patch-repair endonuclease